MRVLHVCSFYAPAIAYGGPVSSIHNLCKHLALAGTAVDVLTTNANGKTVSDVPVNRVVDKDGIRVLYGRANLLAPFIFSADQVRLLRKRVPGYDIVHLHSAFTFSTALGARFARRGSVPHVISPRGPFVPELIARRGAVRKALWLSLVDRRNLESADAVHATSEHERNALLGMGIRPRRVEVIPNGVEVASGELPARDSGAFRAKHGLGVNDRVVLFLGRINWEKGLDLLVPAFGQVLRGVPDARLVLAGPDPTGYLDRLLSLAGAGGFREKIHATGLLAEREKWEALAASELAVLPSYSESFGLAALEAAGAGIPVVVSRGVGVAPAIEGARAGIVAEIENGSIARAILGLLRNPDAARRMGLRGRRLVEERFLWPSVARRFLDLYEEILSSRRGNRSALLGNPPREGA